MKTNIFDFKKQHKNKIVLEEEKLDSPLIIFLKKNKKVIILLLALLALIMAIIAIYYALINIENTSKVVTNLPNVVVDFGENGNTINSKDLKPTTGGEAIVEFYTRYGNIGLKEGVILKVKEIITPKGKIIYYTDGSSMLIKTDGTIIRISSLENNAYGINDDGILLVGAKTKEITITKEITLDDGTKITYYSDNSCTIYVPNNSIELLARNSEEVKIEKNRFKIITPSGISKELNTINKDEYKVTYYEDGTTKITYNNNIYIIRNEEDFDHLTISFPNNNQATITKEIELNDNTKIIYYTDGSAEIVKDNNSIMVRRSKDIIYTKERIIEIIDTEYANISKALISNKKQISYLNNGGALILNEDGTYSYFYENSDIKYDKDYKIKQSEKEIKEIQNKTTKNGTIIIDLEDGNSIIIDENGYKIVKTSSIVYDKDGNILNTIGKQQEEETTSVTKNHLVIENHGEEDIKYHIGLELSDNYKLYANKLLPKEYLRYNIIVDSTYLENQKITSTIPVGTILEGNVKIENETYILYEGLLKQGKTAEVELGIWIDYLNITNEYQESVFVGTLVVYSETIE